MKTLSNLQDYFYNTIRPELLFLEIKRVKVLRFLKIIIFIQIILSIIIIVFLKDSIDPANIIVALIFGNLSIFSLVYKFKTSDFRAIYKDLVIKKIIEFIDNSLTYQKKDKISKREYESSMLFTQKLDKFGGDDLVEGKINGVNIKFSEIWHKIKEQTKKNKTTYRTIFHGVFFIADFNKSFNGKTLIYPDNSEKLFGSISHIFQSLSSKGELIKLDNPEFEKEFKVYGSDQIEARYILSHSLMSQLLELKKRFNKNLYVSFINSKIYIAINFNKELFEPKIYKKTTDFNEVKEFYTLISSLVNIVNLLNLDRKIWLKGF